MSDDDRCRAHAQGVAAGHTTIRRIGELEATHRVEPHHPHPVRDERVLPALRRERAPVGVGNDLGTGPLEDDGAEMMVGGRVGEHKPGHRLLGGLADRLDETRTVARAREGVDHDYPLARDDESRIRPTFNTTPSIPHDSVDAWCEHSCWIGFVYHRGTEDTEHHRRTTNNMFVVLRVVRALRAFVVNSRTDSARSDASLSKQRSLAFHHEDTKSTKDTKKDRINN